MVNGQSAGDMHDMLRVFHSNRKDDVRDVYYGWAKEAKHSYKAPPKPRDFFGRETAALKDIEEVVAEVDDFHAAKFVTGILSVA